MMVRKAVIFGMVVLTLLFLGISSSLAEVGLGGGGVRTSVRAPLDCGAVIGHDYLHTSITLTRDDPITQHACTSSALVISKENFVLDCNGLTIMGEGGAFGIQITAPGVTVKNCRVERFDDAITLGSANNKIMGNELVGNKNGIIVIGNRNTITNNFLLSSGIDGDIFFGSSTTANIFSGNDLFGSGISGEL